MENNIFHCYLCLIRAKGMGDYYGRIISEKQKGNFIDAGLFHLRLHRPAFVEAVGRAGDLDYAGRICILRGGGAGYDSCLPVREIVRPPAHAQPELCLKHIFGCAGIERGNHNPQMHRRPCHHCRGDFDCRR